MKRFLQFFGRVTGNQKLADTLRSAHSKLVAAEAIANTLRREGEAAVAIANRLRREVDVQTATFTALSDTHRIAMFENNSMCTEIEELTTKVQHLTHMCEHYGAARNEQDATIAKQNMKINNLQRVIRKVSDDIGATSAEERTV